MKPKPVNKNVVCSLCGEDWDAHGDKPTSEDCIRILLAKVRTLEAQRPSIVIDRWHPYPAPYPVPYPVPPIRPYWITTSGSASGTTSGAVNGLVTTNTVRVERTPAIEATCSAVA